MPLTNRKSILKVCQLSIDAYYNFNGPTRHRSHLSCIWNTSRNIASQTDKEMIAYLGPISSTALAEHSKREGKSHSGRAIRGIQELCWS